MPRTARDQSATGIYHVMIRGINRQDIFVVIGTGTWGMRDKFIYHVMIRGINRQEPRAHFDS